MGACSLQGSVQASCILRWKGSLIHVDSNEVILTESQKSGQFSR